jgi:hypothetical protein
MNPLAGVLGESWQLYRTYARHLLTIAIIVYVIAAVVSAVLELTGGIFGALLGFLVTIVAWFLLTAALVKAVQDVRGGTVNLSVGQTLSAVAPMIGPVAIAAILAAVTISFGFAILIIPGLLLLTAWFMIVPAIVLEGTGPLDSFGRSWQLVRSYFWNAFGIVVMVCLILFVANLVIGLIFSPLPHFLGNFLSSAISGTLVAPFMVVVSTLMYFRLSGAPVGTAAGTSPSGGPGSYGNPSSYGQSGPFTN